MGEAKRRKQSEPDFGRVPKRGNYRGLVISPPIEVNGGHLLVKSSHLDPQELRFALLFWDRLVWPSSRAMYLMSGADESFLESEGVLTRPDYTIYGDGGDGLARGQVQAYQDLEQAEPGVWALAQGENSLLWKGGLVDAEAGTSLELHRAIPIPTQDVPLAEILEFKLRRADELLLLRHHLESFVSEIEGAEDKAATLEKHIANIDQACANLLIVGKEWQCPVYLSNIKTSFSLSAAKFGGLAWGGWKMGEPYGLVAAAAAAAIGGVASTVEIKADYGFRSAKRSMSPYRYAYQIHQELQ